jgi:plastocyanin
LPNVNCRLPIQARVTRRHAVRSKPLEVLALHPDQQPARRPRIVGQVLRCLAISALVLAAGSCAGSSPNTPSGGGSPTCSNLPNSSTILIVNDAVCPKNVTVPVGSQVTFINNDVTYHQMFSDPHPEHTDCPEINQVGYLSAGQSRQTGNLNTVRVCGYHDHMEFENKALQGTITIH